MDKLDRGTPWPTRRRTRARLLAAVLLAGLGLLVALVVAGRSRHVKIVRVVVTAAPRALPVPPTTHRLQVSRTTHRLRVSPSLPAASAGSNGSFTPPTAAADQLIAPDAVASFTRFASTLPGAVGVSLASVAGTRRVNLGVTGPAHGWSTTKVPVLVALLQARGPAGLAPTEQQWAQLAITQSDNQSVLDLFGDLEQLKGGLLGASDYIQRLFRSSGDGQTVVATAPPPPGGVTTFGQTEWAPINAVKFFQALGRSCLLPPSQTSYVINLMEHIIPSESWGLGQANFTVPVAFKGGWGPEGSGYLVRQSGIIDPGSNRGIAVSMVAYPPAGQNSFSVGTQMLTSTARWLQGRLRLDPSAGASCA